MSTLTSIDYTAHGFTDRADYLQSLVDEYGQEAVDALTSVLPASEDFDGLVTELEELSFMFE
jgi:hypothetical protein